MTSWLSVFVLLFVYPVACWFLVTKAGFFGVKRILWVLAMCPFVGCLGMLFFPFVVWPVHEQLREKDERVKALLMRKRA